MQETEPYQIMRTVNGKINDDSIQIKVPKIQIGQGSTTLLDLFLTFMESLEMNFSK